MTLTLSLTTDILIQIPKPGTASRAFRKGRFSMTVSGSPLRRGSVFWMAHTAILMGMNIVLSMSVFSIPVPGGHLYFCDTVINIAAILLDPMSAFLVGGVG